MMISTFAHRAAHRLRSQRGYRVASVPALLASLAEADIDTLILEPNLPGKDWVSLLTLVREKAASADLLIVTAFPSRALADAAQLCGARCVLLKPVTPSELEAALRGSIAPGPTFPVARELALVEWEHINRMLLNCRAASFEAARLLGIPRQTLYRKLRKHPPYHWDQLQSPRHLAARGGHYL